MAESDHYIKAESILAAPTRQKRLTPVSELTEDAALLAEAILSVADELRDINKSLQDIGESLPPRSG